MRLFVLICANCEAEVGFRHPAVTTLEHLATITVACPRCSTELRANIERPIKVHTKGEVTRSRLPDGVVDLIDYKRKRNGY